MKKIGLLDISVAVLAALSCLLMVINIPVWALFIGWAWYFALGATPDLIKKGILPMLVGSVLAIGAFVLINMFALFMPALAATMLSVLITVFLLMLTLKIPALNISLISFNAYSCMFVGYGAGAYLAISGMPPLLNAAIWITGANFLGLIFGWLSIKCSSIGQKVKIPEKELM
ncbi:DUF1097 domain-containing protein [Acetobacterium bakii]|uniref:DUF1097 domain-containing protein n=1 Tax=Acetobacterium bakii TaxID=52689 RepID=A0A0L6TV87_9FIRM|nr:DUF1097 domain-containing protein [Acetobacterium bakii]KNZ40194.1 hypothetical protein AKG39_18890 [Acetobacterium bakii]